MDLKTPLSSFLGIRPAGRLKRLELFTIGDLIYHFPFRYADYSKITKIAQTQAGEQVTIQGEVWKIKNDYTRGFKSLTKALLNDGTGALELIWFNQPYLTKSIEVGNNLQISGKTSLYKGKLSIIQPEWETSQDGESLHTGRLVPIYPETYGVSSKWIRVQINKVLPQALKVIEDFLPQNIKGGMLDLTVALEQIHFPQGLQEAEIARVRLGFDELFLIALATLKIREEWKHKVHVATFKVDPQKLGKFIKSLPFELTNAQKKVLEEILADLKKGFAMNRLVQGEVGSGKTVIATTASFIAHLNGLQTLFMAPTEILAWQHYDTVSRLLEPHGIRVGIYTGSRKFTKNPLNSHPDVIIGTHALLSKALTTKNVGLVIIDEQHRFGVAQRTMLRGRGISPHFLTLSATPIPRTVALTLYGDLDLSILDELPKGRPNIKTYLVPEEKRQDAYKFIANKVRKGDQVYIITPLIEQSETLASVRAAKVEYERLKKIFPTLSLGLLHGRMKGKEKEQVLKDFREGMIKILVSTSVVEVGMDIPNATIMVIEGAERFGLAQLHQLRGRIGRGTKQSFCLLFTSDVKQSEQRRLKYLETTFDGLKLAELDLKIRGAGEIFGTRQAGRFELKIASLSDSALIEKTRETARKILQDSPTLDKYPLLNARLSELASNVMPD